MNLSSKEVILLLKSIAESLTLGRSIENSLFHSIRNLSLNNKAKEELLKLINLGNTHIDILKYLSNATDNPSLSRVWLLVSKMVCLSNIEAGKKINEIASNLEKNKLLYEKRQSLIKAQKYKIIFLGTLTSILLGVIAGLAPLFSTFILLIRNIAISRETLISIPISLYIISEFSIYFLTDLTTNKLKFRNIVLSTIAYIISFFATKLILNAIFEF